MLDRERIGQRLVRPRPRHAAGADRRPHRPPRSRREDAAPARIRRRPRVLARRARAPVARRRRARGAARRPAPARVPPARAALVDLRRDRLPLQARAHPRGRVHGHGEARACAVPRALCRMARRANGRGARRDSRIPPRPVGRVPHRARGRTARGARAGDRGRARQGRQARASPARRIANARKLGLRALELRPTLGARYVAARAAWRLQDWSAVQVEMEQGREQHAARRASGCTRRWRSPRSARRRSSATVMRRAHALVDEALEILPDDSDPVASLRRADRSCVVGGRGSAPARTTCGTWSAHT